VKDLDDVSRYAEQLKMNDFAILLNHEFEVFTKWSQLKPTVGHNSIKTIGMIWNLIEYIDFT
jgi:hypothetical protein